jgi:dihydroorotase
MVGLESALGVVQASVIDNGLLDWADVARVFSTKPAEIGRLAGYAAPFAIGSPANLTLYDPAVDRIFGTEQLHGKGRNSPYLGRSLPGLVVATIHDGYPTVLDGVLLDQETVAESARSARG